MRKIVVITFCFLSICSLFAQNANEELNGVMIGNSGWNELIHGRYSNSIEKSREALKFDQSLSYAHFNMALAYLLNGEDEIALKEYKAAIERTKRYGIPNKKFEAAIKDILEYMEIIPSKSLADDIIELIKNAAKDYVDTTVMFQHVPNTINSFDIDNFGESRLDGLKITTLDDSNNMIWTSEKIIDFIVQDSLELLIKVEIPQVVFSKSKKVECQYFYSIEVHKAGGSQSMQTLYSTENKLGSFANIKLNLHSTPSGAEVFLVPNRVWIKDFEGKDWESFSESYFDSFRVNGTTTNAFTQIDETVYVVVFKLKDVFKTRTFYTKPAKVQPEQTVTIKFE